MPESPGRFIDDEASRAPAAGSWKLLYTVPPPPSDIHVMLSVHVCNGKATDAHISLWVIPMTDGSGWVDGAFEPPGYTIVCEKIRVESDGIDGNIWGSPVLYLNPGDRLVGFTSIVGVTFYPHGIGAE